jgi:hypothetical protein
MKRLLCILRVILRETITCENCGVVYNTVDSQICPNCFFDPRQPKPPKGAL